MKKTVQTTYTDTELRKLIREELQAVLNNETEQITATTEPGYITLQQAAEYVKLKSSTLYNMVHKTEIPFHKSGKRVLFIKSELAEWIKSRAATGK